MIFIFDSFSFAFFLSLALLYTAFRLFVFLLLYFPTARSVLALCYFCIFLPLSNQISFDSLWIWILHLLILRSRCSKIVACLFSFVLIISRVYRPFIAVCCLFYMDLSFNIFLVPSLNSRWFGVCLSEARSHHCSVTIRVVFDRYCQSSLFVSFSFSFTFFSLIHSSSLNRRFIRFFFSPLPRKKTTTGFISIR